MTKIFTFIIFVTSCSLFSFEENKNIEKEAEKSDTEDVKQDILVEETKNDLKDLDNSNEIAEDIRPQDHICLCEQKDVSFEEESKSVDSKIDKTSEKQIHISDIKFSIREKTKTTKIEIKTDKDQKFDFIESKDKKRKELTLRFYSSFIKNKDKKKRIIKTDSFDSVIDKITCKQVQDNVDITFFLNKIVPSRYRMKDGLMTISFNHPNSEESQTILPVRKKNSDLSQFESLNQRSSFRLERLGSFQISAMENPNLDAQTMPTAASTKDAMNQVNELLKNQPILQQFPKTGDIGDTKDKKEIQSPASLKISSFETAASLKSDPNHTLSVNFPLIDMQFKNAKLKDVVNAMSDEYPTNFIYPQDLGEIVVSVSFKRVPWDEALEALLESQSLGLTKLKGNIIRIDKLESLSSEKKNVDNVKKSASLLVPTKVLVSRLSYAVSDDVAKMINDLLPSKEYDKRVKVSSDKRTNSIIVEAIPDDLQKVKTLLEKVDQQTPQVKITTRVIEVLKDMNDFLGINWGGNTQNNSGNGLGFGNFSFPNSVGSTFDVNTTGDKDSFGSFGVNFGSINNAIQLDLKLKIAEAQNYSRSLQNSSVLVLDNEPAVIEAGSIDYFSIQSQGAGGAAAAATTQMTSVEYTLKLEVKPKVTSDGAVQMQIKLENSSPKEVAKNAQTSKTVRTVHTSLIRQSGETAVIGGLYTTLNIKTTSAIPYLSKLPIIGLLFSSTGNSESKRELMIMVTPNVNNSDKSLVSYISDKNTSNSLISEKEIEEDKVSPTKEDSLDKKEDKTEKKTDVHQDKKDQKDQPTDNIEDLEDEEDIGLTKET